jgi:transposase-like protein
VDLGYQKYFSVNHGDNEFASGPGHINEIESFWGYAETRLVPFRGLKKESFHLHLKECELRFNHRGEDLNKVLPKILRSSLLF